MSPYSARSRRSRCSPAPKASRACVCVRVKMKTVLISMASLHSFIRPQVTTLFSTHMFARRLTHTPRAIFLCPQQKATPTLSRHDTEHPHHGSRKRHQHDWPLHPRRHSHRSQPQYDQNDHVQRAPAAVARSPMRSPMRSPIPSPQDGAGLRGWVSLARNTQRCYTLSKSFSCSHPPTA